MDIPVNVRLLFVTRLGGPSHVQCTNLAHVRAVRQLAVPYVWKIVMIGDDSETTLMEWLGLGDAMRALDFLRVETKKGERTVCMFAEADYIRPQKKGIKILTH